jgi:hypothetical protein
MKPSPPASDTAAASCGVDEPPANGAPTTGISINDLNASVFMIASLSARAENSRSTMGGRLERRERHQEKTPALRCVSESADVELAISSRRPPEQDRYDS